MTMETTPCERYGYVVGDLFKVIKDSGTFVKGSIIQLSYDDGTRIPRFKLINGNCISFCNPPYENESYENLSNIEILYSYNAIQMDKKMKKTPCERDGYKIGDRFIVTGEHGTFTIDSIVELIFDDGTSIPKFRLISGNTTCSNVIESYESLYNVRKIEKKVEEVNIEPNNESSDENATALKFDSDKAMISLIDPVWLEDVSRVLMFGAEKYSKHNWKGGFKYSRLLDAAYRHIGAFNNGEENDPESGLSHLDHAACCLMFLSWMVKNRPDLDDRYGINKDSTQQ